MCWKIKHATLLLSNHSVQASEVTSFTIQWQRKLFGLLQNNGDKSHLKNEKSSLWSEVLNTHTVSIRTLCLGGLWPIICCKHSCTAFSQLKVVLKEGTKQVIKLVSCSLELSLSKTLHVSSYILNTNSTTGLILKPVRSTSPAKTQHCLRGHSDFYLPVHKLSCECIINDHKCPLKHSNLVNSAGHEITTKYHLHHVILGH